MANKQVSTSNPGKKKFNLRMLTSNNQTWLFIFMILVFFLMGMIRPQSYFSLQNFESMAFQFPEVGILAIGVMLAIISGGIDLSMVGSANLAGILAAMFMVNAIPADAGKSQQILYVFIALIIAIVVGAICGYLNGLVITKLGTPALIVTLGSLSVYMGIAIILTGGKAVLGFPEFFAELGNGKLFGFLPNPFIFFVIVAIVIFYLLQKTPYGIKLYMTGSNETAAEFSGINKGSLLRRTYMIAGILAGIAGFILIARTNQAKADYGTSYTLQSIMVAVLGGVDPNGGRGTVTGVIMAVLTMQFLSTGMNMFNISNVNFLRQLVWGLALVLVMTINYLSARRKQKIH
jgi:simple sugar transport system permease protein